MQTQLQSAVGGWSVLRGLVACLIMFTAQFAWSQNQLQVESAETAPGSPVSLRLLLTNEGPVQGFQTAVTFDTNVLTLDTIDTLALDVEVALAPAELEFFLTTIDPAVSPSVGWGAVAAIFDSSLPFDGQLLQPGADQSIVRYNFTTANNPALVGTCTNVQLTNGLGPAPGINNVITINASSVPPLLIDGQVCFVDLPLFRRGDSNQDGISNIADGIFLLLYLFANGAPPLCLDAVDVNDDEMADLSDFISALNYQFNGGPPPAEPFVTCGVDATGPDLLGCLSFQECGTFNPPPTLTSITPNTGVVAGGVQHTR